MSKKKNVTRRLIEKVNEKIRAKEEYERGYASRQASVDTEIANASNGKVGSTRNGVSSTSNSLKIKRKNYSSMYSGAGRNIV
nr:MAG TPA: hypothetical protein [Bacteriophage sp.]